VTAAIQEIGGPGCDAAPLAEEAEHFAHFVPAFPRLTGTPPPPTGTATRAAALGHWKLPARGSGVARLSERQHWAAPDILPPFPPEHTYTRTSLDSAAQVDDSARQAELQKQRGDERRHVEAALAGIGHGGRHWAAVPAPPTGDDGVSAPPTAHQPFNATAARLKPALICGEYEAWVRDPARPAKECEAAAAPPPVAPGAFQSISSEVCRPPLCNTTV
jgi:hypothetical protein